MKTFLIAIALALASVSTANASWYWVYDSTSGYYVKSDGSNNDGFYYTRKGCCYPYDYVAVKAIPVKVSYAKGWQEAMVNATYALQDRQAFLESQKLLLGASGGYSSNYLSQETIQTGHYPLGYQAPDDGNYIAHAAERVALRVTDSSQQLGSALITAAEKKLDNDAQTMAFQSYMAFLNSPKTVTRTFSQTASGGTVHAQGAIADPVANLRQLLAQSNCASCHSGANVKAGLDIMGIANYPDADRAAIREESLERMIGAKSDDDATRMPQNHPKLSESVAGMIADWIWQPKPVKAFSYKPKAQAELPPVPNPPSPNP